MGGVGGPPSAEDVVRDFMAAFMGAWRHGGMADGRRSADSSARTPSVATARLSRSMDEKPSWKTDLSRMMSLGGVVDADIRHLLSDGAVVMIERVDYVRLGGKLAGLKIAGVFDVYDRVITGWVEHFDPKEFGAQLSND